MLDAANHLIKTTLREAHIDPKGVSGFLAACREAGSDLHAVLLVRDGKIAWETAFAPYEVSDRRHVFSVSKSWTSTAVGFAVSEGRFSLHDKVVSFFPDECPESVSENLAAMEVRHLLTMGTGQEKEPPVFDNFDCNWAKAFLSQPVEHAPGSRFSYNSVATYMLSAIVQKTTGEDLIEYLTPRLFAPLGIEGVRWGKSPQGICCGGWGIHVTAEEIAKLGLLYLNGGVFGGKRVLPEEWVREATSAQIDNSPNVQKDWEQGYGYQIWRCQHGCFRFDGAYGQYMVAIPQKNAVLVVLSHTGNMQVVMDALWEHLLPAFDREETPGAALPAAFSCPLPEGVARDFNGEFFCGENPFGLRSIAVTPDPDGGVLHLTTKDGSAAIPFGVGEWKRVTLRESSLQPFTTMGFLLPSAEITLGAAAGWQGETFTAVLRHCGSPHSLRLALTPGRELRLTPSEGEGCAVSLR